MDQVTTFLQENLRGLSRDPDDDKFLTKTMINNYVKNKVLIPPVRKKYGRDHILLLIFIYYLKNILSLEDIKTILDPVSQNYAFPTTNPEDSPERQAEIASARKKKLPIPEMKEPDLTVTEIYQKIFADAAERVEKVMEDCGEQIDLAFRSFPDLPEEEAEPLRYFDLICMVSAEIYMKKLFVERLIDSLIREENDKK
jgi:DNA-binding transcriptional MerR regulator